jgi:hypothetical protein
MLSNIISSGSNENPFTFGAPAVDDAFLDRENEVRELAADLRTGQDVVVVGPRRYGKSSLVWRVAQHLPREGVLIAQVNLIRTPTKERFAERLATTIYEEIATPLVGGRDRVEVFASLRAAPVATVSPETGALSFSFGGRSAGPDIDATIEALLALPGRLAAEHGRAVAIVLDDFQEILAIDSGLLNVVRSVFQEQREIAHVYLLRKRHMMSRIFEDANGSFWSSAKQIELGPIAPDRFAGWAALRFTQTGKTLGRAAAARAMHITGGHPYATQEVMYFLWEATPHGMRAGEEALESALEATLRAEHAHFSLLWDRAAPAQRMVLQALAVESPGRPLGSDYQQRHRLPSTATVQTALSALVRAEYVRREGRGAYTIAEPFLAEWIARHDT